MSEPRIYTGAEALALREAAEHPIAPTHTHALTLTTGETALLHAAPDLAASVAHHEARAQRAEADRDAALVAVASLPADTLARAEAVVAVTWPGRALVWRVMTAEALNAALREAYVTPTDSNRVAFWFACEAVGLWSDRWPKEFRFWSASDAPPEAVVLLDERRRLYPAMRAIAMRDTDAGPRPTGLHLVALDAGRVTLAVEALS